MDRSVGRRDLERVAGRLQAALAARIADAPEEPPGDLHVSPDLAWESLVDADLTAFSEPVARAAELLDLDPLSVEVLWLCAAPELDERFGRVFAFMVENASRKLP